MTATVFLDRDNELKFTLLQDGKAVAENAATRATYWLPASAFNSNTSQTLDSSTGSEVSLATNATEVLLKLGALDLREGEHTGFLSIFDQQHVNGIAWDTIKIKVEPWQPSV